MLRRSDFLSDEQNDEIFKVVGLKLLQRAREVKDAIELYEDAAREYARIPEIRSLMPELFEPAVSRRAAEDFAACETRLQKAKEKITNLVAASDVIYDLHHELENFAKRCRS